MKQQNSALSIRLKLFISHAAWVIVLLSGGELLAEERGTGTFRSCVSIETCFDDGSCTDRPYKAHFMSVRYFDLKKSGNDRLEFLVNGPTFAEAGGGTFSSDTIEAVADASSTAEILDRGYGDQITRGWIAAGSLPSLFGEHRWLFYVRPANEVVSGMRGHAATKFSCSQVLF